MAKSDKKIAGVLAKRGLIDVQTRDDLIGRVESDGKTLTELLLEESIVSEKDLISCVAEEANLTPIDLARVDFDKDTLGLIPEERARNYGVLPLARVGRFLTLATADPFDITAIDDLRIATNHELMLVVTSEPGLKSGLERAYASAADQMKSLLSEEGEAGLSSLEVVGEMSDDEDIDLSELQDDSSDSPVVKFVNFMVLQALQKSASDIHVEPYEKTVRVRFRIDGVCIEVLSPPKKMFNAIVSRIKIMSSMDIAERRKAQDGKFSMRYDGRQIDFRVSVLPIVWGEKVVIRILDTAALGASLGSLGFEEKALKDFETAIRSAYGMVLVTGPTGSGKSTTLYSAIKEVMNPASNITTVEDPVEYQLPGINQVPVSVKRGLTFSNALRSILRQDPDTIMIGEIRDEETAEIAIKAALTGHLVLSTLHTNDAASTLTRLVDMGIERFLVASSVLLVSAQRLVRKLCVECKEPGKYEVEKLVKEGMTDDEAENAHLLKPVGCPQCTNGYKGRTALLETIPITEEIRRLIVGGASAVELRGYALENEGMLTLRRVGLLNALRGVTSLEEVLSITMR